MKRRRSILSAIVLSILLLGFVACAKSSALSERDATENDRAYVKTHAVYNGSFKSELTEDQLVIYSAFEQHYIMERSLEAFEIDVSKMCFLKNEPYIDTIFENVLKAFKHDFPEAYWIETDYLHVEFEYNGSYISKAIIQPVENYNGALSEWETVQNGIESSVNEILALRKTESRYDNVKAIHDYICDNASFTYEDEDFDGDQVGQAHCIAPFFGGGSIGRQFVCEGYAMTFKLLCDRFNIPAATIDSRDHAYNYVQMDDGCYYAVDCTWDDSQTEGWKKRISFTMRCIINIFLSVKKRF